MAKFK